MIARVPPPCLTYPDRDLFQIFVSGVPYLSPLFAIEQAHHPTTISGGTNFSSSPLFSLITATLPDTRLRPAPTPIDTMIALDGIIDRTLAESALTTYARHSVAQYIHFLDINKLPEIFDHRNVLRFVYHRVYVGSRLGTRVSTVSPTHARRILAHLSQFFELFGVPHTLLQVAVRGFSRKVRGLLKALPMLRKFLPEIIPTLPPHLRPIVVLAFKTLSRISDMLGLLTRDVSWVTSMNKRKRTRGLLFAFGVTKSNQAAEPRPDHIVILPLSALEDFPEVVEWLQNNIPQVPNMDCHTPLFTVRYRQVLKALRALPPPPALLEEISKIGRRFRKRFTCHSMKVGAADHAWFLAAKGKIAYSDIAMLLKHRNHLQTVVPIHTVGYAPRWEYVARALGTERILALM